MNENRDALGYQMTAPVSYRLKHHNPGGVASQTFLDRALPQEICVVRWISLIELLHWLRVASHS
jgi:hypothetical protein